MSYLIGQILFCLFLALLLGAILGWHFRGTGRVAETEISESDKTLDLPVGDQTILKKLRVELESAELTNKKLEAKLDKYKSDTEKKIKKLKEETVDTKPLEKQITDYKRQIKILQKERDSIDKELNSSEKEKSNLKNEILRIGDHEKQLKKLESEKEKMSERAARDTDNYSEKISGLQKRIHTIEESGRERLGKRDAKIHELRSQLEQVKFQIAKQNNENKKQVDDLQRTLKRTERERDRLIQRNSVSKRSEKEQPLPQAEENLYREETVVKQTESLNPPKKEPPQTQAPVEKDDLKLIRGIGPVLERTLNELGITSFRQIATLNPEDVKQVAEAIDTFPDRIERDDWIGGAKAQFHKKYGKKI